MKNKLIILGIVLLSIINLSALTTLGYHRWCRYRAECQYRKNCFNENDFYKKLSLSKSQIEKMKTLRHSFLIHADQTCKNLCKKRAELVNLLTASESDSVKIHAVLGHIDSMQAELQRNAIYYMQKEKEILNPEQQEQFFSVIKERLLQNDQIRGLDPLESSCNVKCQELKNNSVKK